MRKAYRRNTSLQQEDCFPNSHRPYCVFVDVWVLFPLFMNSVILTRWKSDSILKFLTVAKAFYYYFSDMSHTF